MIQWNVELENGSILLVLLSSGLLHRQSWQNWRAISKIILVTFNTTKAELTRYSSHFARNYTPLCLISVYDK